MRSRRAKQRETSSKERVPEHQVGLVNDHRKESAEEESEADEESVSDKEIYLIDLWNKPRDESQRSVDLQMRDNSISCIAKINTGCSITLIQEGLLKDVAMRAPGAGWSRYRWINNSKLNATGVLKGSIVMKGTSQPITVGVVPNTTMSVPLLIGRDTLRLFGYKLIRDFYLNIDPNIAPSYRELLKKIFCDFY